MTGSVPLRGYLSHYTVYVTGLTAVTAFPSPYGVIYLTTLAPESPVSMRPFNVLCG